MNTEDRTARWRRGWAHGSSQRDKEKEYAPFHHPHRGPRRCAFGVQKRTGTDEGGHAKGWWVGPFTVVEAYARAGVGTAHRVPVVHPGDPAITRPHALVTAAAGSTGVATGRARPSPGSPVGLPGLSLLGNGYSAAGVSSSTMPNRFSAGSVNRPKVRHGRLEVRALAPQGHVWHARRNSNPQPSDP